MVTINGATFNEFPDYCYGCAFFLDWGNDGEKGTCTLFGLTKNKYDNLSKRCRKLFDKAKTFEDGTELVIVEKN